MSKFSHRLLKKIQKQKIAPRPAWYFAVRKISLWIALVLLLIGGGIVTGVVIKFFTQTDLELLPHYPGGIFHFAGRFAVLFFLGIAVLAAVLFLAVAVFREMPRGYRIKSGVVLLAVLALSIFFGASLLNTTFFNNWERAHFARMREHMLWSDPERGLLSGRIVQNLSGGIVVEDLNGARFSVDLSAARQLPLLPFTVGEEIRVVGERISPEILRAHFIRSKNDFDFAGCHLP
jgi:hypothetical protein